jgi:hypothetical protein
MSFITGRWISLPLNDAPFASHRVRYEVGLNGRGMHFYRGQSDTIEKYAIPHWALAGIALLAVWGSSLLRKRPGILPGRCARCGYDLRATPGRCPECGPTTAGAGPPA